MKKIFAIGDIHGCFSKLSDLIKKIPVDFDNDTLVFLGDYIDRGMDSFETVSFLIQLEKRCKNTVFLKGNHEEMLEDYLKGDNRLSYLANGGRRTIDSYTKSKPSSFDSWLPKDHLAFFYSLRLYYETGDYIFVHAGLRDSIPLKDQSSEDLLWIRKSFIKSKYDFGKRVIFGHTPLSKPMIQENKIGIDTGAVYGNKLTCIELPEVNFYSA